MWQFDLCHIGIGHLSGTHSNNKLSNNTRTLLFFPHAVPHSMPPNLKPIHVFVLLFYGTTVSGRRPRSLRPPPPAPTPRSLTHAWPLRRPPKAHAIAFATSEPTRLLGTGRRTGGGREECGGSNFSGGGTNRHGFNRGNTVWWRPRFGPPTLIPAGNWVCRGARRIAGRSKADDGSRRWSRARPFSPLCRPASSSPATSYASLIWQDSLQASRCTVLWGNYASAWPAASSRTRIISSSIRRCHLSDPSAMLRPVRWREEKRERRTAKWKDERFKGVSKRLHSEWLPDGWAQAYVAKSNRHVSRQRCTNTLGICNGPLKIVLGPKRHFKRYRSNLTLL